MIFVANMFLLSLPWQHTQIKLKCHQKKDTPKKSDSDLLVLNSAMFYKDGGKKPPRKKK